MNVDDPAMLDILRRCMVARIATLSCNGRPSINPLYFVYQSGRIWLGTSEWTLAARNVQADSRVSVLSEVEQHMRSHRVLHQRTAETRKEADEVCTPGERSAQAGRSSVCIIGNCVGSRFPCVAASWPWQTPMPGLSSSREISRTRQRRCATCIPWSADNLIERATMHWSRQ